MKKGTKGLWHPTEEQRQRMSEQRRGRKLSPEHIAAIRAGQAKPDVRQRMSESHKGLPGPNKGKARTLESRQKQSASMTGKPLSPEHAAAVVASQRTPEARAKMSESVKRAYEDPEMRSRHHAGTLAALARPEVREKISKGVQRALATPEYRASLLAAARNPERRAKQSAARLGKPLSDETKAKIRVATAIGQTKRWARTTVAQRRQHTRKAVDASIALRADTSIERQVKAWLIERDIAFEQQYHVGWYHVDFYVAALNLIIEVNGCYWHSCEPCGWNYPKRAAFDARKAAYLTRHNYTLVVLWEHELKRGDFSALTTALGIE